MVEKRKRNDFLEKFHVYGGLASVGILIIFSFSAYVHQHHPKFAEPREGKPTYWEQSIDMPEMEDHHAFKLAVRDSLGLFGHAPWWEDYTDSLGVMHFMITRPGKQYWVTVPETGNTYMIKEHGSGLLNIANQLHPLSAGMQNAGEHTPAYTKVWRFVMVPMGLVLIMVVLISLHFWLKRSIRKKRGWITIGVLASVPILLFIMIWLVG